MANIPRIGRAVANPTGKQIRGNERPQRFRILRVKVASLVKRHVSTGGALLLAVALIAVGAFESFRLLRLISLERQGKCDYVPCANEGTYHSLEVFLLLTIVGLLLLGALLLRQRKLRT